MQAPFHLISCSLANTVVEPRICIDTFPYVNKVKNS